MKKLTTLAIACLFLLSCGKESGDPINTSANDSGTGTGGSLARFAIVGNHLYTVDMESLNVFELGANGKPSKIGSSTIGFGIETIFPKGDKLFIGSQLGMFIYDVSSPANPQQLSRMEHVFSCDPVAANDSFAFVTLHTGGITGRCFRGTNELQVYDVRDLRSPRFMYSQAMTRPLGLGVDQNTLFICDYDSLKVYSIDGSGQLSPFDQFAVEALDVIPLKGVLLLIAKDGFYQYRYGNGKLELLSKIPVS